MKNVIRSPRGLAPATALRKTPARPRTERPEAPAETFEIAVDYPQRGERVVSAQYTLRVGTLLAGTVEVSIDGGAWRPCRTSAGYWWYDWSGYESGIHTAVARVRPQSGRTVVSARCHFLVELPA